jgi:hypothetical protein
VEETVNPEMPLTDHDFAMIRASVRRTIESRQRRRGIVIRATQCAFAVLAMVLIMRSLTPRKTIVPPSPSLARAIAEASAPVVVAPVQPAPIVANATPRRSQHHGHRTALETARTTSTAEPTQMRIELATADPDIRIIWLPNDYQSR